uniref:Uncharacterized protein n=1 Tax=Spongospora subterranea TaxID=70186 RepID=A0A0H5QMB5_9EUKA|eukprot:CRZ03143.1 hypothetical protein [Spongospora subterranea]
MSSGDSIIGVACSDSAVASGNVGQVAVEADPKFPAPIDGSPVGCFDQPNAPSEGETFDCVRSMDVRMNTYSHANGFMVAKTTSPFHEAASKLLFKCESGTKAIQRGYYYCNFKDPDRKSDYAVRTTCPCRVPFTFNRQIMKYIFKTPVIEHNHPIADNENAAGALLLLNYERQLLPSELEQIQQLSLYNLSLPKVREMIQIAHPGRNYTTPLLSRLLNKGKKKRCCPTKNEPVPMAKFAFSPPSEQTSILPASTIDLSKSAMNFPSTNLPCSGDDIGYVPSETNECCAQLHKKFLKVIGPASTDSNLYKLMMSILSAFDAYASDLERQTVVSATVASRPDGLASRDSKNKRQRIEGEPFDSSSSTCPSKSPSFFDFHNEENASCKTGPIQRDLVPDEIFKNQILKEVVDATAVGAEHIGSSDCIVQGQLGISSGALKEPQQSLNGQDSTSMCQRDHDSETNVGLMRDDILEGIIVSSIESNKQQGLNDCIRAEVQGVIVKSALS